MDVPPSFDFEAEVSSKQPFIAFATLNSGSHPLSGLWVRLSKSDISSSEYCSVAAFNIPPITGEAMHPDTDIIAGCAFVEVES